MNTPFADIAVVIGIQARELAHRADQNEQVAIQIGLFPNTTAHLVAEWRKQADIMGEAHRLVLALLPIEHTIRAVTEKAA